MSVFVDEMGAYYKALKALIEETYEINNNTRVVTLAHSMGNPVLLYFFNNAPQSWKDKYIQSFISLASPWAGAVKTLRLFASGEKIRILQTSRAYFKSHKYLHIHG